MKLFKLEEKKVEKITFRRRGFGDSWLSSILSLSLLGNLGGNINVVFDKFMVDLSDEDDDDDGNSGDIFILF